MPGIAETLWGRADRRRGATGRRRGNLRGPDVRGAIKADLELLDQLPEENVELRARLRQSIDARSWTSSTPPRKAVSCARSPRRTRAIGRDIVVFVARCCSPIVWWNVPHSRTNWLVMFVFLILLSGVVAVYGRAASSGRWPACATPATRTTQRVGGPRRILIASQCRPAAASS